MGKLVYNMNKYQTVWWNSTDSLDAWIPKTLNLAKTSQSKNVNIGTPACSTCSSIAVCQTFIKKNTVPFRNDVILLQFTRTPDSDSEIQLTRSNMITTTLHCL